MFRCAVSQSQEPTLNDLRPGQIWLFLFDGNESRYFALKRSKMIIISDIEPNKGKT